MKARARRSGGSSSRLRRRLRFVDKHARSGIKAAFTESGKELADAIEAAAPKDTGGTADEVRYKVSNDGLGVSVGYSAKAAGFKRNWKRGGFKALWQEFGTRHHAAQPFIRPSYRKQLKAILDRIDDAVRTTIRRLDE